jgi:ubiquinone/menaquinone biosynthesis C-methylase UbiE
MTKLARGIFPHRLSRLLDNPLRRLLLSPKLLVDRLELSETSRVLEVGPGSGFLSGALAKRVARGELVLLDIQPEMLAKAKRKLDAQGLQNVRYLSADASKDLPWEDCWFDLALLVCVLGEIPDQRACLRSLHRILRADGKLVIHESLPDPDMLRFDRLRSLLQAEGYTFLRRWGSAWNYTAVFQPADSAAAALG